MKRVILTLLIVFMAFAMTAGTALAAGSPVSLSHTLAAYTPGTDSVTLDFVLHLENTGATPLYSLTLDHVAIMLITLDETILNVGTIDAYGALDIPFTIVVPALVSQEEVLELPLFWAGEGNDSAGVFMEFPAESRATIEGGAQ